MSTNIFLLFSNHLGSDELTGSPEEFVFIDTEEVVLTHEDDFTVVDLVSSAVPPEAQSHPELVETIISNPRHERLICVRSFPISLEEPTMNEICAQVTVVDGWLNIELENASF